MIAIARIRERIMAAGKSFPARRIESPTRQVTMAAREVSIMAAGKSFPARRIGIRTCGEAIFGLGNSLPRFMIEIARVREPIMAAGKSFPWSMIALVTHEEAIAAPRDAIKASGNELPAFTIAITCAVDASAT
jgi:hypothetical protein